MAAWNFATLWEIAADNVPEAPALAHGTRTVSWADFDHRADGVARHLLDGGTAPQDKVALYLYNGPEYLEACFAAFKAGLVPVNTNYRYADDELVYLWDNADAVAVVFHGTFTERVAGVRAASPGSAPGCGSTTAATRARRGRRPTNRRRRRPPRGSRHPGVGATTTCS